MSTPPPKLKTKKPPVVVDVAATISTGQYPPGHDQEGEWAVQVVYGPIATEDLAGHLAATLERILGRTLQ